MRFLEDGDKITSELSSVSSEDSQPFELYYGKFLEIWRVQFVLYNETKFSTVSTCVALAKVQWQYGAARDSCNAGLFLITKGRQKT